MEFTSIHIRKFSNSLECGMIFLLILATSYPSSIMAAHFTEQEIFHGLQGQDSPVLEYCYQQFGPMVRKWILNHGGSSAEADDVFQDGIIALYTNIRLGKFELRGAKISTYLLQICKFKWLDIARSSGRSKVVSMTNEDLPDEDDYSEDLAELARQKRVHLALEQLSEQCRKILEYFYWERKSMEEISELLSMKVNSVKNGKYRCIQTLKDQFKISF